MPSLQMVDVNVQEVTLVIQGKSVQVCKPKLVWSLSWVFFISNNMIILLIPLFMIVKSYNRSFNSIALHLLLYENWLDKIQKHTLYFLFNQMSFEVVHVEL